MTAPKKERDLEPGVNLRPATPTDLQAITDLLTQARLPTAGVEDHLETFLVVEADREDAAAGSGGLPGGDSGVDKDSGVGGSGNAVSLVGVGGLEVHWRFALFRSLAVGAEHRRQGLASMICDRLEEDATRRGVSRVYLLTETAAAFFANRGYSVATRKDAPAEITATEEFTTLCPDSAVLMVRTC